MSNWLPAVGTVSAEFVLPPHSADGAVLHLRLLAHDTAPDDALLVEGKNPVKLSLHYVDAERSPDDTKSSTPVFAAVLRFDSTPFFRL